VQLTAANMTTIVIAMNFSIPFSLPVLNCRGSAFFVLEGGEKTVSRFSFQNALPDLVGWCLVLDLEYFDFLDLEIHRTREKRLSVQSGVVGVTVAKGS
jgi:hypothetical protein